MNARPHYYKEQLIYHESSSNPTDIPDPHLRGIFYTKTWRQRYYLCDKHFKRPGPIFLIMGGEEEITPQDGILYPFVSEHLAPHFSAMVIQPEHRFYGDSQPLGSTSKVTNEALIKLMHSEQAMWDAVKLVDYIKSRYGCASSSTSEHHCPVIAVGGSYPGFLAAMMRFVHPDKVDAAYAASAPMQFYAQKVEQWAYYDHITKVADKINYL